MHYTNGLKQELGCVRHEDGHWEFCVWAPNADSMAVRFVGGSEFPMKKDARGYWYAQAEADAGSMYWYVIDGETERPDPASRFQPQGVHGPSAVYDVSSYDWRCKHWTGLSLEKMVFYEMHIGTFTPEGTFEAAIDRLNDLVELGVNVLEIMPVAQFPGARNWGYDGVYPFAVQESYGGPTEFMKFIDACHTRGLAVCLDVVYNHLGPEGNYLWSYGPYFTDRYRTPWGAAVNFDGERSDAVRHYFIQNALQWLREFRIDVLRLDATHAIFDFSAKPFLEELGETVDRLGDVDGRRIYLVAENDMNDPRFIQSRLRGGYGLHAQWCDDFHHIVHTMLTGEDDGYYADFNGGLTQLAEAFQHGYIYRGAYSPFRKRRHGKPAEGCTGKQFVVCVQNHDQVGNRMMGERFSTLLSFEKQKLAASLMMISPFVPMLFMGEEYGEEHPFLYFVSHGDENLIEAVRKGRRDEFKAFSWRAEPPDPQDEKTFTRSKLQWQKIRQGHHGILRDFYRALIRLRRHHPALGELNVPEVRTSVFPAINCLYVSRRSRTEEVIAFMNFGTIARILSTTFLSGVYELVIDSADVLWQGPGASLETVRAGVDLPLAPYSCAIYRRDIHP